MDENRLSNDYVSKDSVAAVVGMENFSKLSEETQKAVIDKVAVNTDRDGGYMGKFLGNKKDNAAMHIAFILCVLLFGIGIICNLFGKDYWNAIIPSITTVIGYMFGKGGRE